MRNMYEVKICKSMCKKVLKTIKACKTNYIKTNYLKTFARIEWDCTLRVGLGS